MEDTKSRLLKVAVIGTGSMGTAHCKTIAEKIGEMELVAVCDGCEELAKKAAGEFEVPFFTDVQDLLDSGLAEAAIVATPHTSHAEVSISCLERGLHVLCEKPLTENIATASRMVNSARNNNRALAIMYQRRLEPAFARAIELVKNGELGEIHRTTLIAPDFRSQAYYDSGTWRATWKGEGGGVMINQGTHLIDIFCLLGGLPCKVRGRCETRLHDIEVEDVAEAMLTYKNGASGLFYCSTNEHGPGQMIEIFGEKGKLIWRDGTLEFFRYEPGVFEYAKTTEEKWTPPAYEKIEIGISDSQTGTFSALENFARHILYGEELKISGESSLASLELTNAIMLSSWKNREQTIPVDSGEYTAALEEKRRNSTFKKKQVKINMQTDPSLV